MLIRFDVRLLHELGDALERIIEGGDPRRVFRQHERRKPRKDVEHMARALAYWSVRALNPRVVDKLAIRRAQDVYPGSPKASTIRRIAGDRRAFALLHLETMKTKFRLSESKWIYPRTAKQIADLREHLRRKSARQNIAK